VVLAGLSKNQNQNGSADMSADVDTLHVERNMVMGVSYLDIEDIYKVDPH
jgi:hypothetical protein